MCEQSPNNECGLPADVEDNASVRDTETAASVCPAEPEVPQAETDEASDGVKLRGEIDALREELARLQRKNAAAEEREHFRALFPDANPDCLPDAVRADCEHGIPLSAAYALWLAREKRNAERAEAANAENRRAVTPRTGKPTGGGFYSAAEVKALSQSEVRLHYAEILDSMRHWH